MKDATILVIEENQELSEIISGILQLKGYTVLTARDGKKGLQMALSNSPDLIVCDVAMSESPGFEELNKIQKKEGKAGSIFLFPEPGNKKGRVTRTMVSTSQHIIKPFEPEKFLEMVAELFPKKNQES